MPKRPPRIRIDTVRPRLAIEGARVTIEGSGFAVDGPALPEVRVGGVPARVVFASATMLGVIVPPGLAGGESSVEVNGVSGPPGALAVAPVLTTGIHQVDSPVFDRDGNLYVTYSGTRGDKVPVSVFRVRPDGTREAWVTGLVNATSLAIDPRGIVHVSSRFDGTVYMIHPDGHPEPLATELGAPCGLAFAPDGTLYIGDRNGTVFRMEPGGKPHKFVSLPPSLVAFHLALGPDAHLYVTAPTLSAYDHVYRIDPGGHVDIVSSAFGRPQGLAFDSQGRLHVVEALAGSSGLYRLGAGGAAELVLAGPELVGVAIDAVHGVAVASSGAIYRVPAGCW